MARTRVSLAWKLGGAVLAVVGAVVVVAGLLSVAAMLQEFRWFLSAQVQPLVRTALDEQSARFVSLLKAQQDEARAQAEQWFSLTGKSMARSLAEEILPLAEGYDYDAIRVLLETRIASTPLLLGARARIGLSGEDVVEAGTLEDPGGRIFRSRSATEYMAVDVEILVDTRPLRSAFERMDRVLRDARADVTRHQEALRTRLETQYREASRRTVARIRHLFLVVGATAMVLAALLLGWLFIRVLSRPLQAFVEVAEHVAAGDLTRELNIRRRDEIGALAHAFRCMTENLRAAITRMLELSEALHKGAAVAGRMSGKIREVVEVQQGAVARIRETTGRMDGSIGDVASRAETLTAEAEETSAAVQQMSASVSVVSRLAKNHARSATEAAERVESMIESLTRIATHLDGLTATSEEITTALYQMQGMVREVEAKAAESADAAEAVSQEASERGIEAVRAAVRGIEEIVRTVEEMGDRIDRLGRRSDEIGQIVTVIDEIADQTKLLSLNAAILAAQAGERGKAFSVVANEIKALAERTSVSTREISRMIEGVQADTREAVAKASEGIASVRRGKELVQEVEAALESIRSRSDSAAALSRAIQEATADETAAVTQIAEAVSSMNDEVESIAQATREQDEANRAVLELMGAIRTGSGEVVRATSQQADTSQEIAAMASRVAEVAVEIAHNTQAQREMSESIVRSVEEVGRTLAELAAAAADTKRIVEGLECHAAEILTEAGRFRLGGEPGEDSRERAVTAPPGPESLPGGGQAGT